DIRTDMLRGHHTIRAAICLAADHSDLRNCRLGERIQKLGSVPDDPEVLVIDPRQEAGDILERDQRNVEAITETYESCSFYRRVDVENTCKECRLIGHDADRLSAEPSETDHNVCREVLLNFEEVAV